MPLDAPTASGSCTGDVSQNILLDGGGTAHLVDFGLSHALVTQVSLGLVHYSLARFLVHLTSSHSNDPPRPYDVYALACRPLRMLTGTAPFAADGARPSATISSRRQPRVPTHCRTPPRARTNRSCGAWRNGL